MKKLGPLLFTRGPHFCSLKCGSLFLSLQIPSFAHSEFWTSLKSYPWYWEFDIIFVAKCCFVQGSCAGAVPATRSRSKKDSQYFSVSQAKPRPGTITFILSLVGPFWGKRPFLIKPHWCSACYHGILGQPTLPGEPKSQAKPGVRHYCVHRSLQQTPPHPQADPYRYPFGKPYGYQYVRCIHQTVLVYAKCAAWTVKIFGWGPEAPWEDEELWRIYLENHSSADQITLWSYLDVFNETAELLSDNLTLLL